MSRIERTMLTVGLLWIGLIAGVQLCIYLGRA
jgi:hypothetical protein